MTPPQGGVFLCRRFLSANNSHKKGRFKKRPRQIMKKLAVIGFLFILRKIKSLHINKQTHKVEIFLSMYTYDLQFLT
ncbi:hypothetical protein DLR74_16190 [Vibrio paracholerae]|nr:hypothetical protein DLR74_16190 [Vibrio paracholerae]